MARAARAALAVLVAGVLLAQQVPFAPSGHHAGEGGHSCTERTCHCVRAGRACPGASCPRHADHTSHGATTSGETPGTQTRCSRPAPERGAFATLVVFKSLFAPVAGVAVAAPPPLVHDERREVFASQHYTDELFRPPRPGIG